MGVALCMLTGWSISESHSYCLQSCKNIDHYAGHLYSVGHSVSLIIFTQAKIFEHTPHIKLPGHISEHSYYEHSKVESRVVGVHQYRKSNQGLCECSYQN